MREIHKSLFKRNEELLKLSMVDGLTGLANRRAINELGEKIWEHALSNNVTISFIMIDIDFFKQFNDLYGHMAGDKILCNVARVLNSTYLTSSDLVGRFGGEEFLILLYNRSRDETFALCEQLRQNIENLEIRHENSTFGILSISLGMCTAIPSQKFTYDYMLKAADEALYIAKNSGRNCVKEKDITN